MENVKAFLQLVYHPTAGMGEVIDRARWLYCALAVLAVSIVFQFTVTERIYTGYESVLQTVTIRTEDGGTVEMERPGRKPLPVVGKAGWLAVTFRPNAVYLTVVALALLYIPAVVLMMRVLEGGASFGMLLRREYGALSVCTFSAWAVSHAVAGLAAVALPRVSLDPFGALMIWTAAKLWFGLLMLVAIRTVFGAGWGKAGVAVAVAWTALIFESYLVVLASPFALYWAYIFLRGEAGDIAGGFQSQRSFKRILEAATINPHDAEAQYQLGLIHQRRRQTNDAIARFTRAVEIDPRETDAHFQLGRIAREQNRLSDAIAHFNTVVAQDEKHAHHEIWREVGATYLAAGMPAEAREALERYTAERPYDPEGLYYLGETLGRLGETANARGCFDRCVEAVQTMPYYRRGQVSRWRKLAQDKLRTLAATV